VRERGTSTPLICPRKLAEPVSFLSAGEEIEAILKEAEE